MRKVLDAGPWFFGSRPLVLKPWSIDSEVEKIQDCSYPLWVQFPNLKLNLWSATGISKISSLIGCPITTDMLTATRQRLSYARVLLEVKLPLKESLPDTVEIQGPDGKSIGRMSYMNLSQNGAQSVILWDMILNTAGGKKEEKCGFLLIRKLCRHIMCRLIRTVLRCRLID